MKLDPAALRCAVHAALAEDLGDVGDVTTAAAIPPGRQLVGELIARSELILAGLPVAREVFRELDAALAFDGSAAEGQRVAAGTRIAVVRGDARPILAGERTALNFLQRMCGIATAARAAVDEVEGTGAIVLDTRKTAPGLRMLDKYAVAAGGATNHRIGLFDAVMIKDTHLEAVDSIGAAVAAALADGRAPANITVEVRDSDQLREAIAAGAGRALLDNMDLDALREAVAVGHGRIVLEASGGLGPGALRAVAETGVDCLSLGYLTHSVLAADVAMETRPIES